MKYPQTSAKRVLADIARNTGGKLPSAYHDDILEWLPEGIDMLTRTSTLETNSTPSVGEGGEFIVKNHVKSLPCDLVTLLAVEDDSGRIIPEGGDITDLRTPTIRYAEGNLSSTRATVFEVDPMTHQTSTGLPTTAPGTTIPIYGEDIRQVTDNKNTGSYYKISGNCIQTSFECGFIKLHYLARPLGEDGYPLIPDNQNFRTALYWYVLGMLIGAGFEHPVFNYDKTQANFELYAARAIGEITYPSLDEAARINRSFVRLVPPTHFYEDFFTGSEQTQSIRL